VAASPVIGSIVPFLRDPMRFFLRQYRLHGPVFRLRMGLRRFTVLCGPEAARWVTRHESEFLTVAGVYDNIHRIIHSDPAASMMSQDGARHAELRKWNKRGMSRGYAEEHADESLRIADDELDRIGAMASTGVAIDVVDFAKSLVYRQLGMTMTGAAPPELLGDCRHLIDAVINAVRFPASRHLPISPRVRRAFRRLQGLGSELARRYAGGPKPGEPRLFVHDLLAAIEQGVWQDHHFTFTMLGPYLAGLDTLAHQLAFAVWALVSNPAALARVRDDIDRVVSDGAPDARAFKSAEALRGAAMEAERLYPISPGQLRRVTAPVELGGYQLRAGDDLMLPHAMPHFMEEYFPAPDTFDIDRFGPERAEHHTPGAYVPYGLGRHICLGAGTADFLLLADIACLFHRYDVAAEPGYHLRVRWTQSGTPHKFRVHLTPRRPRQQRDVTPARPSPPPPRCPMASATTVD
jgi:cytochrome P450